MLLAQAAAARVVEVVARGVVSAQAVVVAAVGEEARVVEVLPGLLAAEEPRAAALLEQVLLARVEVARVEVARAEV